MIVFDYNFWWLRHRFFPPPTEVRGIQREKDPMKSYGYLFLLLMMVVPTVHIDAAQVPMEMDFYNDTTGPMDANWFYGDSPYYDANRICEKGKWKKAADLYETIRNQNDQRLTQDNVFRFIHDLSPEKIEYDKHMGLLNQGMCSLAQGQASPYLASVDFLVRIPEEKRISKQMVDSGFLKGKSVLVRTDKINDEDCFYFLEAVNRFKQIAGCFIKLSVRSALMPLLSNFAKHNHSCDLVDEEKGHLSRAKTHYVTHLVSLAGYLQLSPDELKSHNIIPVESEDAHAWLMETIKPHFERNKQIKNIIITILGNTTQTTLLGGKKLAHYSKTLSECAFCVKGFDLLWFTYEDEWCEVISKGSQRQNSFDKLVSLAHYMNSNQNVLVFCIDTKISMILARFLDPEAQKRMSFVLANPHEINPFLGDDRKHSSSNCYVYRCTSLEDQKILIKRVRGDMRDILYHSNNDVEEQLENLEESSDDDMTIE